MVVAVAALVVAAGGVAFATIPDSNGTIHGCYDKKGDLRVVESAADCLSRETALDWNQQGPPGPPGGLGTVFAEETAEVTTRHTGFAGPYVDLGGPTVDVIVPASGLVAAFVRADVHGTWGDPGPVVAPCIQVFLDGAPARPGSSSTGTMCLDFGTNSYQRRTIEWFAFEASPGPHSVGLRYRAGCIAGGPCPEEFEGFFKNRKLWVVPLG